MLQKIKMEIQKDLWVLLIKCLKCYLFQMNVEDKGLENSYYNMALRIIQ